MIVDRLHVAGMLGGIANDLRFIARHQRLGAHAGLHERIEDVAGALRHRAQTAVERLEFGQDRRIAVASGTAPPFSAVARSPKNIFPELLAVGSEVKTVTGPETLMGSMPSDCHVWPDSIKSTSFNMST